MAATHRTRPLAVTVLGVLCIIQGVTNLLGGVASVVLWAVLRAAHVPPGLPADVPPIAHSMAAFPAYAWAAGLLLFVLGGLTLAGGIGFVALRAWGRVLLEVLAWVWLLFDVLFAWWWAAGWLQLTAWARQHEASGGPPPFADAVGLAVGAAVVLAGMFFAGLVLYFLRSRPVREAMQR